MAGAASGRKGKITGATQPLGLLVGVAACLGGCVEYGGLEAPRWTLTVAGEQPREIPIEGSPPHLPLSQRSFDLSAEFALPPGLRGRPLSLAAASRAPLRLVIDGEPFEPLESSFFERYMGTGYGRCFAIPARLTRRASLPVTLTVTRTVILRQRFDRSPRLSADHRCIEGFRQIQAYETLFWPITSTIFAVLAIVHLSSFVYDRRRRAEGWFAVLLAALAAESLERVGVFQPAGIEWWKYLGFLHFFETAPLLLFLYAFLERRSPPLWLLFLQLFLSSAAVLTWSDVLLLSPLPQVLTLLLFAVTFGAALVLVVRSASLGERRVEARAVLASWGAVGLVWLCVLLFKPLLSKTHTLVSLHNRPLSVVALSVVHTILLARHRTRVMRTLNEELTARVEQLEARNREVASLNDDLRHQLRARSRALGDELCRADASAVDVSEFSPGSVVGDRYRVLGRLGEGGMGLVFTVEQTSDRRRLALKVLHRARSGAERARLAREAELVASVAHPRLVSIVDVGVSASGQLYIVMELVEGKPLSKVRDRLGDVPWALSVLKQIAEGLSALHQAGVVHRDLKPDNVLLTGPDSAPSVKIVDFGIAFRVHPASPPASAATGPTSSQRPRPPSARPAEIGALTAPKAPSNSPGQTLPLPVYSPASSTRLHPAPATARSLSPRAPSDPAPAPPPGSGASAGLPPATTDSSLTVPGQLLGTPEYMAPELAWGSDRATAASDIWSLGVVAHVLLTRHRPFDEPPIMAVICGLPCPAAAPLASLHPHLHPALGALLDRCLHPYPAHRPSAQELAAMLPSLSTCRPPEDARQAPR